MDTAEFFTFVAVGFAAQLIDGALGMAYGVTASSLLLTCGVSPAVASATVHIAECFTTGASAISHRVFGNIDKNLFRQLLLPGVLGAVVGAYVISNWPTQSIRPIISLYLLCMGGIIIAKAFRSFPSKEVSSHVAPLAFSGALLDAAGGGGWGPIVSSTLIARGNELRFTVGSVNAVEFFVAFAASATFVAELGGFNWELVAALALGGLLAAPIGAWACKSVPHKPFMVAVGALIMALSVHGLIRIWL